MLPHRDALNMRPAKLEKIFLSDEALGEELLLLAQADAMASIPENGEPNLETINLLVTRLNQIKEQLDTNQKLLTPALITGHDLIALGLKPGKIFGEILELVREAQLEGKISDKEEAKQFVQSFIEQQSG